MTQEDKRLPEEPVDDEPDEPGVEPPDEQPKTDEVPG